MRHEPGHFVKLAELAREAAIPPSEARPVERKADLGDQVRWLAGVLLQRRRLIASFAISGALLAGIAALAVPPSYTATAQFLVLPEQGGGESDESAIDTQITVLNSDAHLGRVLDSLKNSSGSGTGAPEPDESPTAMELFRTRLRGAVGGAKRALLPSESSDKSDRRAGAEDSGIAALKQALKITQERRSRVIAVRYSDRSSDRAAAVANRIVQIHIEGLRDAKQEDAELRTAWFDRQLKLGGVEMARAEADLRAYQSAHGTRKADSSDLELIAERRRQLALVRADAAEKQARLDRIRALRGQGAGTAAIVALLDSPVLEEAGRQAARSDRMQNADPDSSARLQPKVGARGESTRHFGESVALEIDREVLRLDSEAQLLRAQALSIEQHLASLQRAASLDADESVELSALERRVAAAAKQLDDLRRRQQESAGQNELASLQARLLALASRPTQPNSANPTFIVTAALIAFAMLGSMVAVTMDRLDQTLRSTSDVFEALGIPCIGLVPELCGSQDEWRDRQVLAEYDLRCCSIVLTALRLVTAHRVPRILLVTSSVPNESKTTLAMSIGMCAARLGRRVLLVDFSARQDRASGKNQKPVMTEVLERLLQGDVVDAIRHSPQLGFDHLAARRIGIDMPLLISDHRALDVLRNLGDLYDCVIVDGPAIFASDEARLLATVADDVIFAVRWASTTRDVARHALEVLRQSAGTASALPVSISVVLTQVDLGRVASFRELPEFLPRAARDGSLGFSKIADLDPGRVLRSVRTALARVAASALPRANEVLVAGGGTLRSIRAALGATAARMVRSAHGMLAHRVVRSILDLRREWRWNRTKPRGRSS